MWTELNCFHITTVSKSIHLCCKRNLHPFQVETNKYSDEENPKSRGEMKLSYNLRSNFIFFHFGILIQNKIIFFASFTKIITCTSELILLIKNLILAISSYKMETENCSNAKSTFISKNICTITEPIDAMVKGKT